MQRDANEVTRALAAVRAMWQRAEREAAFAIERWALELRREG
jgi:hypothetical protein